MTKVVNVGVFLPLHKGLRYMVTIILLVLMLLSGAFGFLMRKQRPLIRIAGQTITYVVYVLLLVMGVVLGKNDELFAKLPSVGSSGAMLWGREGVNQNRALPYPPKHQKHSPPHRAGGA